MGKNHRCVPLCGVEWAPTLCAFVDFCMENHIDADTMISYAYIWEETEMICDAHMDAYDARQRQWIDEQRKRSRSNQQRLHDSAGSLDTGVLSGAGMGPVEISNFLGNERVAAIKPKANASMKTNHDDDATSSVTGIQGTTGHTDDDVRGDDGVMLGADSSTPDDAFDFEGGDAKRDVAAALYAGILAPGDVEEVSSSNKKFGGDEAGADDAGSADDANDADVVNDAGDADVANDANDADSTNDADSANDAGGTDCANDADDTDDANSANDTDGANNTNDADDANDTDGANDADGTNDVGGNNGADDTDDDAATHVYEFDDLAPIADVSEDVAVSMSDGDAAVDNSDAALMDDTEATAVAVAEAVLVDDSDYIPAAIISDADAAEEEGWLGFEERAFNVAEAADERDGVTAAGAAAVALDKALGADKGVGKLIVVDHVGRNGNNDAISSSEAVASLQKGNDVNGAVTGESSDDDCVVVGHRPAYIRIRPPSPCCEWERRMKLEIDHVAAMEKYRLRRKASSEVPVADEVPAKKLKMARKKVSPEVKAVFHQLSRMKESDEFMVDTMLKFVEAMKTIWSAQEAGVDFDECDPTCIDYELP